MDQTNLLRSHFTSPAAFYFALKFPGFPNMHSSFQEVSGLKVEISTEETIEVGENTFKLRLPETRNFENLVLKRCLLHNSDFNNWCIEALENFRFDARDISLQLCRGDGGSLASWSVKKAFPISWVLSSLDVGSEQLVIETLTLKYQYFKKD